MEGGLDWRIHFIFNSCDIYSPQQYHSQPVIDCGISERKVPEKQVCTWGSWGGGAEHRFGGRYGYVLQQHVSVFYWLPSNQTESGFFVVPPPSLSQRPVFRDPNRTKRGEGQQGGAKGKVKAGPKQPSVGRVPGTIRGEGQRGGGGYFTERHPQEGPPKKETVNTSSSIWGVLGFRFFF